MEAPPVTSANFRLQKLSAGFSLGAPPRSSAQIYAIRSLYHTHSPPPAPPRPCVEVHRHRTKFVGRHKQLARDRPDRPILRIRASRRWQRHPSPAAPPPQSASPRRESHTSCSARSLLPARV